MGNEIVNQNEAERREIIATGNDYMIGLNELKNRACMVSKIKKEIMKKDVHWGLVPGCGDKPTLLKNGAELLCMAFRLAPNISREIVDLGNGHREITVTTTLSDIGSGAIVAAGIGSCSTMESKYRYRNDVELTGRPIPSDSKERKAEYRRQGYGMKKVNGTWEWVKFVKIENPDIADTYNTVLKMASKRSLVDAVLKATGGSCEFTQDIEDMAPPAAYDDYSVMDDAPSAPPPAARPNTQKTDNRKQAEPDEDFESFKRMVVPLAQKNSLAFCGIMKKYGCKSIEQLPKESRSTFFKELNVAVNEPKSGPTAADQSRDF